ncbi:MAG: lactate racemase domain-containing protein [candidate division KSB1 bacterium]
MILKLQYGLGFVEAEFRPPRQITELKTKRIATLQRPEEIINQALDQPIGCFPFPQLFKKAGHILLLVPDEVHDTGGAYYLPLLLRRLKALGVSMREVTILVASVWGARRNGVPHLIEAEKDREGFPRVVYHDPNEAKSLEYAGETKRGTPVLVNRLLVDAEYVIICGTSGYHSFAGYRGGPELIVSACSGRETLERNLLLACDLAPGRVHPRCYDGVLTGNPVQEDMREAFRLLSFNFLLHTVLNDRNQVVSAVAGEPLQAHAAGCHMVDDIYRVPVAQMADVTIVSCGGHPHDRNFFEAHRALHHACRVTNPGGTIIFTAECAKGLGSPHLLPANSAEVLRVSAPRELGHYPPEIVWALSTRQKARDYRIVAVTNLNEKTVNGLGFTPAASLRVALQIAQSALGASKLCYLIPQGSTTVPEVV